MSRWGKMDRKSIVTVLDSGIGFLKDEIKDQSRSRSENESDFYALEKLLYGQGQDLLSMTNKVNFEKRLNTVRKNMHKWKEDV